MKKLIVASVAASVALFIADGALGVGDLKAFDKNGQRILGLKALSTRMATTMAPQQPQTPPTDEQLKEATALQARVQELLDQRISLQQQSSSQPQSLLQLGSGTLENRLPQK